MDKIRRRRSLVLDSWMNGCQEKESSTLRRISSSGSLEAEPSTKKSRPSRRLRRKASRIQSLDPRNHRQQQFARMSSNSSFKGEGVRDGHERRGVCDGPAVASLPVASMPPPPSPISLAPPPVVMPHLRSHTRTSRNEVAREPPAPSEEGLDRFFNVQKARSQRITLKELNETTDPFQTDLSVWTEPILPKKGSKNSLSSLSGKNQAGSSCVPIPRKKKSKKENRKRSQEDQLYFEEQHPFMEDPRSTSKSQSHAVFAQLDIPPSLEAGGGGAESAAALNVSYVRVPFVMIDGELWELDEKKLSSNSAASKYQSLENLNVQYMRMPYANSAA
eukprot:CAMPEP_0116845118 /NCGR_PEP_ID=MMETSP0418-20121206/13083_1 /TAXON_ID=1158023 /ORGANISM="Astrosyne radiata, Strain 13vi08-1A" /LENGTH=331 /DNA_ID=CAMNT_0004476181 /DNA_START=144 /DNA_END=1139 /DNA_ORIENTATION=-